MNEALAAPIVSDEQETLIVVDADDNALGFASKAACHNGLGILHRAFSIFLFNPQGALLLQQRSREKRLWPGFWSNSCCSHPRRGESCARAAPRRLQEELGVQTPLQFMYKFVYQAKFGALGSEHECCSVYIGALHSPWHANPHEIAATRWLPAASLDAALATPHSPYTPWLRLEWQRLRQDFWPAVEALNSAAD